MKGGEEIILEGMCVSVVFILLLLLLFVKMRISGLSGRLTWGLDKLFVDSQERRLGLLTALVQSNHLQVRRHH